jgi:hypothetical protein
MKITLNVFMCVRNNEDSLRTTFDVFEKCEEKGWKLRYYIYENDSTDDTVAIVRVFMKNKNGNISVNNVKNKVQWKSIVDINRIEDMVYYRNEMLNLCSNKTIMDYTAIIDTNIIFSFEDLENLIQTLYYDKYISCCTPFSISSNGRYYDTYALRSEKGEKCIPITLGNMIYVKSAFGGICVVRSEKLEGFQYTMPSVKDDNEHMSFCEWMSKHGKIVINKKVSCLWKQD